MIENFKNMLGSKGYAVANISEIAPDFDLNGWLNALTDSWVTEKSSYWVYKNMILGMAEEDMPVHINIEDAEARHDKVKEEGLIVDQQYFKLTLTPNFIVQEFESLLTNMLQELYPLEDGKDFWFNSQVACFNRQDFISPQFMSDKLCQVILCISDVDISSITDGKVTVGDTTIDPTKGTFILADSKFGLGLGVSKVESDAVPRFMFRTTVNLFDL